MNVTVLADALAPVLRELVDATTAPLLARMEASEKRAAELEAALKEAGIVINAMGAKLLDMPKVPTVEEVAALMPKPPTAEEVAALIAAMVPAPPTAAEVAALVPPPEPGKDADPAETAALITAQVKMAVAAIPPAEPGKDADPETVRAMVAEAVAALPKAENGKDATPEEIAAEIERQLAARPAPQDGKSVTAEELVPLVEETVQRAVSALPPAKDGANVEPEAVDAAVAGILGTWPKPKDGTSVTLEDALPALQEAVAKAVAALPVAKDGVGLAGALKDHEGALALTLTDGTIVKLGRVDGEPGKDGWGFDDMEVTYDGERRMSVALIRGDTVKEFPLRLPIPINREIFKDGQKYEAQDEVTFGGSTWQARRDTSDRPGASEDWFLKNKKGRDGKDATEPREPAKVKLR